jgi:hypothetical protein
MNSKKNGKNEKMSEEEFRINRDLLDEATFSPNSTKKNFLI